MRSLSQIEAAIAALGASGDAPLSRARALLALSEETLEHWISAHHGEPTTQTREGFRLLALHLQGCKGMPSFNACRETCREIAYHYNLVAAAAGAGAGEGARCVRLMSMLAMHLYLFVSGKLEQAGLGEFCCSARPLRAAT